MSQWVWGLLALASLWFTGCSASRPSSGNWLDRLRAPWHGIGPDSSQIEFAIVQEELGAEFLADQLWQNVDEQIIPIELRDEFNQNGLRIGMIKGASSATLQKMLTQSETCPTAQRLMVASNKEFHLPLQQQRADSQLLLVRGGEIEPCSLPEGEYGLILRLSMTENGHVHVQAVPYVRSRQYGSKIILPNEDRTGWKLPEEMPEERLDGMAWQVTLTPNDFLIIGSEMERNDSFGYHCFVDVASKKQKILVIRGVTHLDPLPKTKLGNGPIPIAWQAILPNQILMMPRQPANGGE